MFFHVMKHVDWSCVINHDTKIMAMRARLSGSNGYKIWMKTSQLKEYSNARLMENFINIHTLFTDFFYCF